MEQPTSTWTIVKNDETLPTQQPEPLKLTVKQVRAPTPAAFDVVETLMDMAHNVPTPGNSASGDTVPTPGNSDLTTLAPASISRVSASISSAIKPCKHQHDCPTDAPMRDPESAESPDGYSPEFSSITSDEDDEKAKASAAKVKKWIKEDSTDSEPDVYKIRREGRRCEMLAETRCSSFSEWQEWPSPDDSEVEEIENDESYDYAGAEAPGLEDYFFHLDRNGENLAAGAKYYKERKRIWRERFPRVMQYNQPYLHRRCNHVHGVGQNCPMMEVIQHCAQQTGNVEMWCKQCQLYFTKGKAWYCIRPECYPCVGARRRFRRKYLRAGKEDAPQDD